jgi:hypothetical protein
LECSIECGVHFACLTICVVSLSHNVIIDFLLESFKQEDFERTHEYVRNHFLATRLIVYVFHAPATPLSTEFCIITIHIDFICFTNT